MTHTVRKPANTNRDVYGDSAYRSAEIKEKLEAKGYRDRIHRKGVRNKPLDERGRQANRRKSKVRCRAEHVFGRQAQFGRHLGRSMIRRVGIRRAEAVITLRNLVYNLDRHARLVTA